MDYPVCIDRVCTEQNATKCNIVRFLKRNFVENVHYNVTKPDKSGQYGGQNIIVYNLTTYAYDLITSSYGMKNKYVPNYKNTEQVQILMSLENQTIGFIASCLQDVVETKRQMYVGKYKVDLAITKHKIVVECDENGHKDRDPLYEKSREQYIMNKGYKFIRFNPNDTHFNLSLVIREILKLVMQSQHTV
jgi:very-short-patch-repair endonuclease